MCVCVCDLEQYMIEDTDYVRRKKATNLVLVDVFREGMGAGYKAFLYFKCCAI